MTARAGGLGDAEHPAVDVGGHAGDHRLRRRAEPLGPGLADQVVVAADAAGGDDHGLRAAARTRRPRSRLLAAPRSIVARLEHACRGRRRRRRPRRSARRPGGGSRSASRPVAACSRTRRSNGSTTPGPVPQVMWKRGTELPWPSRAAVAALGPADDREEPVQPMLVQPGALLAGGEVDVRLGPAARPVVLLAVELRRCRASPAGRARGESLMPIRRCSGVSTRNSPPSDQNACPPRDCSRLLVEQERPACRRRRARRRPPGRPGRRPPR